MSKIDTTKEQISYLKLWLGVLIAVAVSLAGWFANNLAIAHFLLLVATAFILWAMIFAGLRIHRRIEEKILLLEDL